MLTLQDLVKIEHIVDKELEEKFDEKLKFLPTKEEFYTMMDKLENHEKRIKKIEQHIHPSPLPAA